MCYEAELTVAIARNKFSTNDEHNNLNKLGVFMTFDYILKDTIKNNKGLIKIFTLLAKLADCSQV
jgi:hypothetical protein